MTKKSIALYTTLAALLLLAFQACKEEDKTPVSDIRIGKGEMLSEISLNRQTERKILLSGGNSKFKVNIEDSRIATVSISRDTLKIKGLFEGETFATITSHDKRARLKINVIPPSLGFSRDTIYTYPEARLYHIGLAGGGEMVTLTKDDPHNILSMAWDGKSGIVEIHTHYEGEVDIIARGENGTEAKLHVKIKPDDEIVDPGVYGTNSRYYSNNEIMRSVMMVEKEGFGVTMHNSARPYGGRITTYNGSSLQFTPEIVNPKLGDVIEVDILDRGSEKPKIVSGKYNLTVEEIREKTGTVILRHPRFKVHIPYYTR